MATTSNPALNTVWIYLNLQIDVHAKPLVIEHIWNYNTICVNKGLSITRTKGFSLCWFHTNRPKQQLSAQSLQEKYLTFIWYLTLLVIPSLFIIPSTYVWWLYRPSDELFYFLFQRSKGLHTRQLVTSPQQRIKGLTAV